jgi:hypothetical protein
MILGSLAAEPNASERGKKILLGPTVSAFIVVGILVDEEEVDSFMIARLDPYISSLLVLCHSRSMR